MQLKFKKIILTQGQEIMDIKILMDFFNTPLEVTYPILQKFATLKNAVHRGTNLEQFIYIKVRAQIKYFWLLMQIQFGMQITDR